MKRYSHSLTIQDFTLGCDSLLVHQLDKDASKGQGIQDSQELWVGGKLASFAGCVFKRYLVRADKIRTFTQPLTQQFQF